MFIEYRYNIGLYCLVKPPRNVQEHGFYTVHKRFTQDNYGNLVAV